jgi:hypothetical protein
MKLTQVILDLSNPEKGEKIHWTLRDAFQGVQIFGGIGSGKTSGSGQTLARAFLRKGFGGLVLCAKPDERKSWEDMARQEGRFNDLKIFCEPKSDENGVIRDKEFFFNPLQYESKREGGGDTFNLVNLFMQIYQMGKVISGEGLASGGDKFWDNALKRAISRSIDYLRFADEKVSFSNMVRLITEVTNKRELEHLKNLIKENNEDFLNEWLKDNFYVRCKYHALLEMRKFENDSSNTDAEIEERKAELKRVESYWERDFANLAEKTKTIVVESFLGLAEPFQSGILKRYFSSNNENSILPEEAFEKGKIIILDFPIKDYLDTGIYAQGIFKLMFQQAIERRAYKENIHTPAFLWVDESQNFINAYDQVFQTTARSAGVSTVFLTQNISNYFVAIGGKNPTARVNSLMGNLSTKIFHNNNDYVTNEWAANIVGKVYKGKESYSVGQSQSFSLSKEYQWDVEPHKFTKLKTGGEENDYKVQGVIVVSRELVEGKNFIFRCFKQS